VPVKELLEENWKEWNGAEIAEAEERVTARRAARVSRARRLACLKDCVRQRKMSLRTWGVVGIHRKALNLQRLRALISLKLQAVGTFSLMS
jgi:hypothetical protein